MKTPANEIDYNSYMEAALDLAEIALNSGEFPVGCVIVYESKIIASGCRNGSAENIPNEIDHAEIVTLRKLYEHNEHIDKNRLTLFCTMEPCLMCLGAILLSGITRIVYAYEDIMGGGTMCDLSQLTPLYKQQKISVIPNILRDKSLKLFKAFFKNQKNQYWKGSMLAEYTLNQ